VKIILTCGAGRQQFTPTGMLIYLEARSKPFVN